MGYPKTVLEFYADGEFKAEFQAIGAEIADWEHMVALIMNDNQSYDEVWVFAPNGRQLAHIVRPRDE